MDTLALTASSLDPASPGWDLHLNAARNLSVATGNAALAQDVASAVRTFRGEMWYNTLFGVPYFQRILGRRVSLQFFKQVLVAVGGTVPGVSSIKCFLTGPDKSRRIGGQLQVYSNGALVATVSTGDLSGSLPWWVNAAPLWN